MFASYQEYKNAGSLFVGEYSNIPKHMQESMIRYVEDKIAPGSFLSSVIRNDLFGAVNNADSENIGLIKVYVRWFYNIAPYGCFGSLDKMKNWIASRQSGV